MRFVGVTRDITEQVRAYDALADSDSLVLSGRLTSLDVVDTLTFLEERFNFEMDPIDFDQKKFDSVNSIVAMLEQAGVAQEQP